MITRIRRKDRFLRLERDPASQDLSRLPPLPGRGLSYTNMPIPDPERSPLSSVLKFSARFANKCSKDQNEMWL